MILDIVELLCYLFAVMTIETGVGCVLETIHILDDGINTARIPCVFQVEVCLYSLDLNEEVLSQYLDLVEYNELVES